ncbi:MAG: SDR family NAD(P)-dependent oxidoreductase [Chloroflexi bacterium]|nr:SDR family NAD(P)-dependent oxidoreductase [Chloroflexota bacterium]
MIEPARPLEPRRRAIVVGASSGMGAALVRKLAAEGWLVAALARREDLLYALCSDTNAACGETRTLPFPHDVTDFAAVPAAFQVAARELGGLDLLIYAAGVMLPVAAHEFCFEKDRQTIEVNLLGAIAWLNEAAVRFQRAGSGHIVGISSVAGDRGRVGNPAYNTSKAGLSTYLEALRNRLSRHGVTVTTVKPGFVETDMLKNAPRLLWAIPAERAAGEIYRAILRRRQTVYVPARWRMVMLIIRHIPSFVFRRLSF